MANFSLSELAGDAIAGVEYLRRRKEIDSERIGLIGLSQGSWVAPLAAAKSEQVLLRSLFLPIQLVLPSKLLRNGKHCRQAGLSEKHVRECLS